MTTKIQKWGNSLAMRLPKELARSLNLKAGSKVTVIRKSFTFEVKPETAISPKYTLEELLKCMTKKNIHPETNWGEPMGKEIW